MSDVAFGTQRWWSNHWPSRDGSVESWLRIVFNRDDAEAVAAMLGPLRLKARGHYEHSIRVGLLARQIGAAMLLDPGALLYAGTLHDVGKALVPRRTLDEKERWTAENQAEVEPHVADGWRLLRDRFDFSAEIMAWHHRFQKNCYPAAELTPALHDYSTATSVLIPFYGRLLSMADTFDALHRVNSRGLLTGAQVRSEMVRLFPDLRATVDRLYDHRVLVALT